MEILNEFIRTVENQIIKIRHAVEAQDALTIKNQAHAIKGGAANLTADELSNAAAVLEQSGKSGDFTRASLACADLENAYIELKNFAKTI